MHSEETTKLAREIEEIIHRMGKSGFHPHDHCGLKKSEIFILRSIFTLGKEQPVSPSDIAKKAGVTMAAITHHLNSLEEQGYIKRLVSTQDRRVVLIQLTEKGKKTANHLESQCRRKLFQLVEYLGPEDTAQLIHVFRKIAHYMNSENAFNKEDTAL
jgi:DNA-binding MarR family transcriptional regulator